MGFPVVWAAKVVGMRVGTAKETIATAANIGIVARGKSRIRVSFFPERCV
ncbi:MAG TPA: hypothetical protein VFK01_02680 [Bradyrhizobium sp.]|nr:hypothetical protein [Bradyrhizobium sp.]